MSHPFKVGDVVRVIDPTGRLTTLGTYRVSRVRREYENSRGGLIQVNDGATWYYADRFVAHIEEAVIQHQAKESDPTGRKSSDPGAKLDQGKVRPSLIIKGMARAIWAVSEVATFGAEKYSEGGWVEVPNGLARYDDAKYRHDLKQGMGEVSDADSEKLHLAHEAWCALARLDLYLRSLEK